MVSGSRPSKKSGRSRRATITDCGGRLTVVSTGTQRGERECVVETGEWANPYSGEIVSQAGEVDVDHLVRLKNAHDSGGWLWPR